MSADHWYIAGYDGADQFYASNFSASSISEADVKALLMVLYGKFLTAEEITGSFGVMDPYTHLEVTEVGTPEQRVLSTGGSPYFTATMVSEDQIKEALGATTRRTIQTAPWDNL
jgi:hypothetical protein